MKGASSNPPLTAFPLPDPAIARHPNVLLAPREIRQWLDELPLGNPPRSAQLIAQQLRLLVRDPQPGPRLTSLLDCYLPTLERLQQITDTRLPSDSDSAMPLDQLEALVLEIQSELACGYLRTTNEQLVHGKPPQLTTLVRAAVLLNDATNLASLHYYRPPQPNWQLLLNVYLLASQLGLDKEATAEKGHRPDPTETIHALFFAALFTAYCDPHHHRPSDLAAWHRWLRHHTEGLVLEVLPQGSVSIPVDVSGQLAPLTAARKAKPGPDTRYLVADPLLAALRADEEAPPGLLATLTDLMRGRRSPEQRRAPRQPRNHKYRLLFGLHNIAQRLLAMSGDDDSHQPTTCAGRQINQSKTGSAFELTGQVSAGLVIGEPVLSEAESEDASGNAPVGFLARIQRLVIDPSGRVELGVEKLPGRIMPVTITGAGAERLRGDTAALLLHRADSNSYQLIAARRAFREQDLLSVEGPNVRHSLRLLEMVAGSQRLAFIDVEVASG